MHNNLNHRVPAQAVCVIQVAVAGTPRSGARGGAAAGRLLRGGALPAGPDQTGPAGSCHFLGAASRRPGIDYRL